MTSSQIESFKDEEMKDLLDIDKINTRQGGRSFYEKRDRINTDVGNLKKVMEEE